MPNYITNQIKAENFELLKEKFTRTYTKEELNEDYANPRFTEDEQRVDFNLIVPVSDDLEITSGSRSYITPDNWGKVDKLSLQTTLIDPIFNEHYNDTITQKEFIEKVLIHLPMHYSNFKRVYGIDVYNTAEKQVLEELKTVIAGYFNLKRYGYVDWYSGCVALWGTKWNAIDSVIDEENKIISFDTAWSCPFPVLKELSKTTPILVAYADEDLGQNYGIILIEDGEVTDVIENSDEEDMGVAMAIKGYSEEDVAEHFSEMNYTDEEIQKYWNTTREKLISESLSSHEITTKFLKEFSF